MGPLVAQPAHWAQVVWTAPLEIKLHFHLIDRAVAWLTDWPRLRLPRWYFAAFFFLFWNMWAFFFSLFKKAQSTLNPSAKIKKAFSKNKTDEMMDLWRVFAGMHFEKFLTIDSLGGKRRRRRLPQLWKAPLSLSLQMNCIYTTAQSGLKITCFRRNLSQPASENAPGYVNATCGGNVQRMKLILTSLASPNLHRNDTKRLHLHIQRCSYWAGTSSCYN